MRKMLLGFVALASLVVATTRTQAQNVLYYTDFVVGTDQMAAALAALPGSYIVTTATSDANFTALLAGGSFDLGILNIQNSSSSGYTSPAALVTFVTGGGKGIYADWSQNNTFSTPLGATFTGSNNNSVVNGFSAALQPGVSNPMNLTNPGWGTFSTGLAPAGGATIAASFGGDAAITLDSTGRAYVNGFLNDTFSVPADGVNLYTNEIISLFAAVPEPTTWALIGVCTFGTGAYAWNKRRKNLKLSAMSFKR